ncbi:MAG: phosphatase PAP2-related protein [Bradyrhizobium sp.]|uniref:phosphatase PAP2-related protein n=1 Tax=Bradyrhizobium sp. TaxID=376 RepID=UPI0027286B53|nr:phosphatase PAP2-related protein [Bradyrhizobium sp.]MDO8398352.1 phosphatase PAP2-related protein [Bradyrhizobium sp.]
MQDTIRLYRTLADNRAYWRSVCEGAVFLAASAIAIFAAVSYATVHASNPVTDFVLSRVGPYNLRFLFIYGTFAAFVITAGLLASRPNRLPFALKAMALFLLVRAVFVSLTHVAPSPIDPQLPAAFLNSIFYGSDLFFSGHTGLPLLAAFAFWHIPPWRMFYLALTALFGAVVLLGHYHYSIDVLAALFITHGVFQMSCWLFGRDYALFRSSESQAVPRVKRKASVAVEGVRRAAKPFVLHIVGEDPAPGGQPTGGS